VSNRRIATEFRNLEKLLFRKLLKRSKRSAVGVVELNLDGRDGFQVLGGCCFIARFRGSLKGDYRGANENPDDRNHDHQFDQGKPPLITSCFEGVVHWKFLLLKTSRFATSSEKKADELDRNWQILPPRSICVPDAYHLKKS